MPGLEQLQFSNPQDNMPKEMQVGMSGLNALWASQQADQRNANNNLALQNNQVELQRNQALLPEDQLRGNVASAMNTPENVATTVEGRVADIKANTAEAYAKIPTAKIDAISKQFELAQVELATHADSPLGLSIISNEDVRKSVDAGMKAHPGKSASDVLNMMHDGVQKLKIEKMAAESRAKVSGEMEIHAADRTSAEKIAAGNNATSIANTKAIVSGRENASILRANTTLEKTRLEAAARIEAKGGAVELAKGKASKLADAALKKGAWITQGVDATTAEAEYTHIVRDINAAYASVATAPAPAAGGAKHDPLGIRK